MLHFDHLVYFTDQDLAISIEQLKEKGIIALRGGSHEHWGTHNALCYFGLSYVEYLEIENEQIAIGSDVPLIQQLVKGLSNGNGPGQIAIRTNNIDQLYDDFTRKGLAPMILPGSRKRADGSVLSWKLLFVDDGSEGLLLPFFIDWGQSDQDRLLDLTERQIIQPHPAGNLQMDHLKIIVANAKDRAKQWAEWLNLLVGESYIDQDLNAECYPLYLDGCSIHFCFPLGAGVAQDFLMEKGERPYTLVMNNCFRIE